MKKFKYKVLKAFSIFDDEGESRLAENEEEVRAGSEFSKNSKYVDYDCPGEGLSTDPITKKLKKKGYIELVKTKEL